MSTLPQSQIDFPIVRPRELSPVQFAAVGTALAVLGVSAIWPAALTLWRMWTADATKSIGMVIPLVSLVLMLRAWRAIGWAAEGTWWGLGLLLPAMAIGWVQERSVILLVISPHWSTVWPPNSLLPLMYASGVVLLLGGVRLYRAALFPILLVWLVNPVPHIFSLWVDLPLQIASAHVARGFAMALGQHLTPDHLRLMFTPEFGMFIAPGCNGIRGSVTMGFIALIAGYVYRFRWYANALTVMGAVLLGYAFNLARLCLLVLYYLVALHFTALENKAEGADYAIGGALFLVATLLLFAVIDRLRDTREPSERKADPERGAALGSTPRASYARLAAMGAIALVSCVWAARASAADHPSTNWSRKGAGFPAQLGDYSLDRTWDETLLDGTVVYNWAQYSPIGGGAPIALGVSSLGWHDPLLCHATRGEHPLWQGQLTITTAKDLAINFSSAFYNDGVTQFIEASTQCSGGSCGEFATKRTHFGFVYSRPDPEALLTVDPKRPIPVLLRTEVLDPTMPADAARQQLTENLRAFLASVSLEELTRPYSH
jgi:exosortase J